MLRKVARDIYKAETRHSTNQETSYAIRSDIEANRLPIYTQVVREVTGAGYLCRQPAPSSCVAIMDTMKNATIAAWHPKVTAGPLSATHLTWKYTTQKPPRAQHISFGILRKRDAKAGSCKLTDCSESVDPSRSESCMLREYVKDVC
jgi:hypothetical protein